MTIREEIHAYLDTLPPHVRVRKAAQLLVAAAGEIERLEKAVRYAAAAPFSTEVNEKAKPNPTA